MVMKLILCISLSALAVAVLSPTRQKVQADTNYERATFAGGCFWCMEPPFEKLDGVIEVVSGYIGGQKKDPTYEEVCSGSTGHAEAIQVLYDPSKVTYAELLDVFWRQINPTDPGGQFADRGSQYRTAIFYHDDRQRATAEALVRELNEAQLWKKPIVTQVLPLGEFYPAEHYHREYFLRHPEQSYCQVVISPKISKFRNQWTKHLKRSSTK